MLYHISVHHTSIERSSWTIKIFRQAATDCLLSSTWLSSPQGGNEKKRGCGLLAMAKCAKKKWVRMDYFFFFSNEKRWSMLSRIVKIIQNTVNNDLCLRVPPFGTIFCWKQPAPPKKKQHQLWSPKFLGVAINQLSSHPIMGLIATPRLCVFSSPPLVSQEKNKKGSSIPSPPKGWLPPENSPVFSTQATEVNFTTRGRQLRHLRFGAKAVLVSTGWLGGPIRWGWGERSFGKIDLKQGVFDLKGKRHVGKARGKKVT